MMAAGIRAWVARRGALRARRCGALLTLALMAVPFGSLSALEARVLDGRLVTTVPLGRFIISGCDDADRNSYQVSYLKHNPPRRPMVYVLGGSSVRECVDSPDSLAAAVSRGAGRSVGARMMAGCMQPLAVQLAIVDNLPVAKGGVVVLGIHQISFICKPTTAQRLLTGVGFLAESPALQSFTNTRLGLDLPNKIRDGLRDYLERYRAARDVNAFRAPWIKFSPHRYGIFSTITEAQKRAGIDKWLEGNGRPGGPFERNFDFSAALLEESVKLARAKGFEVVIMEAPQNTAIVGHAFDAYKDKFRPVCRYLRDTYGAHYINLNGKCGLLDRDFRDLYHLFASGRAKWTPKLAAQIALVFKDHYVSPVTVPTPAETSADGGGGGEGPSVESP
jgi:hypothetical protein